MQHRNLLKLPGVPFAKLQSYEKVTKSGYVGTLYGYTGDNDLKNNPEGFCLLQAFK